MPILSRRCTSCGRSYDLLEHRGEVVPIDQDEGLGCPSCGSDEYDALVKSGTAINTGGAAGVGKRYPRMHPEIGYVESYDDETRKLDAAGLMRAEGRLEDAKRRHAVLAAEVRRQEAEANDYFDRLEHSSEFADARRARDKGLITDWRSP